jgi:hypothetical protein
VLPSNIEKKQQQQQLTFDTIPVKRGHGHCTAYDTGLHCVSKGYSRDFNVIIFGKCTLAFCYTTTLFAAVETAENEEWKV